jgi:DNA-binding transcriptional LysR family regulator
MDRLAALTVFRRVVELDGFAAAARDLGYSNAAVSKMVKELEADLGAQLLVRTTRKLHVTDIGRAYYDRLCDHLDGLLEADDAVRTHMLTPRGRLRVSTPMSFGLAALTRALPAFAVQYPDISIDLVMSDGFVDLVEDGFDLAIRGGRLSDSSLKARKLTDIERIVCASPNYLARRGLPNVPDDLKVHDCLVYSSAASPGVWRLVSGENQACAVPVATRYRVNNSLALRDAALEGLGLTFLPRIYVEKALASGELKQVLTDWTGESQALFAVYPAHRQASPKLRAFLDFLVEYFLTKRANAVHSA